LYLAGIEEYYTSHLTDEEILVIGQAFARVLEAEERPAPDARRSAR
jgi:hypothetical protein